MSWKGNVRESKTIKIEIPAGVDEGDRLRVSGEGTVETNLDTKEIL